ncbi:MAG TPA: S1 RNA-binding domain-containing protein [Myxococcales bacterium]|nr:S1 RNA-binding domain-containing protein [Myxococcales bacterium]
MGGSVGKVTAPKKKHPRADSSKNLHGTVDNLVEFDSNRWMSIVRALNEGSIVLNWTHPTDEIQSAGEAALKESELDLGRRKPATVIRELITDYLDEGLQSELTRLSREALVSIAAGEYAQMLCTAAVTQYPVGGVYIGTDKQRLGLATLDKRGSVTTTAPVRPSGDWPARVCRWIQDNRVRMVIIPTTASASSWLSELEAGLKEADIEYSSVSPAGMFAARAADDPVLRRVSPEIASAIVLARRAMQPIEAWSRVEPVKLGLVPMSAGIDDGRLSELLLMVRERCIAESQPLLNTPVGDSGIRHRGNASLNPTVRGIRDLRPGLNLNGVVSNVTKFGAFVNVGVRQEGLVHISELSNDFVEDPNEVVQVGNSVQVSVISVDLERGRIALTMRTESARMTSEGTPMRHGGSQRGGANDGPGRNQALQNLESLFRKSSSSDESDETSSDSSTD